MDETIKSTRQENEEAIAHLIMEFSSMRTGRANVHVLDSIRVNYYGTETPLIQLATISAPDPTLLTIAPFDPNSMEEIEKAIHRSNLGLNPTNDGRLIRLPIPPLTEERRAEMAKIVAGHGEETKTSVRNHRRDANEALKKAEKNKEYSEDQFHDKLEEIQNVTDEFIAKIDTLVTNKKNEIMQV